MKILKPLFCAIFLCSIAALSGCGSSGEKTAGTVTTITGQVVDGFIAGAACNAYQVNANGTKGALAGGPGTTDASGNYTLAMSYTGPVLVECVGGSYKDWATGSTIALASTDVLSAVLPNASGTVSAQVTPLTHMAAKAALQDMATNNTAAATAMINANSRIGQYYGISDIVSTKVIDPTAAGSAASATQAAKDYALVLAGISQYAKTNNITNPFELVTALANDVSDGTFDGKQGTTQLTIKTAAGNVNLSATASTGGLSTAITTFQGSANNASGATVTSSITTTLSSATGTLPQPQTTGGSTTAPTLSAIAVIQTHPFTAYGSTEQFAAIGLYSDGSMTDMTKSVAWSSSTPAVATISSAGLATKAGFGSVTITANDPATGKAGSTVVSLATTTNFNARSIAAGGTTALALLPDGTVWGWGGNTYGQVGDGTSTNQSTPVRVPGLIDVAAIAVGGYHSAAVKLDGTVWAWGDNCCGQLGNGTSDGVATWPLPPHPTPTQVSGFTNAKAVAAALFHTVGLKKDGTVWTWGYNSNGQLGTGNNTDSLVPVQVTSLASVTAVAVGGSFSLALKSDGTVWTWGYNPYGQLGNGTTTDSNVPVQVTGLTNVTAIAAGGSHALAAKSDGTVWAWGYNLTGQLGNGTKTDSTTPVQVSGLTNVTKVAAGAGHSIALKSDATAWVWGDNASKQLGSAVTGTYSATPVQYNGLTGVFSIAANFYDIFAVHHSTVTANACGDNIDGQRGNGTTGGANGCSDVTPGDVYKSMVHSGLADLAWGQWVMVINDKDKNYTYDRSTKVTLLKATATGDILPAAVTSSDPSIIRADSDWGAIETVGAGTATITITWPDGSTTIQTITSR